MEIEKAFILVKVSGMDGLRQVALDKENQEMLTTIIKSGFFGKEIKVMNDVVAEVEDKDSK